MFQYIPLTISIVASALGSRVANPTPSQTVAIAGLFIGGLIGYQILEIRPIGRKKKPKVTK